MDFEENPCKDFKIPLARVGKRLVERIE
jgi:hypothetical protein